MNIHTQAGDCEAEIAAGAQAPCKAFLEWPLLSGWGDGRFRQDAQLLPEVDRWGLATETDRDSRSKTKIIVVKFQKAKRFCVCYNLKITARFNHKRQTTWQQQPKIFNHIMFFPTNSQMFFWSVICWDNGIRGMWIMIEKPKKQQHTSPKLHIFLLVIYQHTSLEITFLNTATVRTFSTANRIWLTRLD